MNIVIIEDEPFAQDELKRLLEKMDQKLEVMACIDSVEDSIAWLQENKPDLIFLDIQLSDGLSFEIFSKLEIDAPVIFTTAYDDYAIKAFELNSIDYLLKPIDESALQDALNKYEKLRNDQNGGSVALSKEQLEELLKMGGSNYKTRFMVQTGEQIRFIDTAEIAYFFADDKYVFAVTRDKRRYLINHTLEELNGLLDPAKYYRVNRRYILKSESVAEVHKYFNSRLLLKLSPPVEEQVLISRVKVSDFLEWMEGSH